MITESPAYAVVSKAAQMQHLIRETERLAFKRVPSVLIYGESGTGKALIAKALHEAGPASRNPFITISCSTLAREQCECELFGRERDTFDGADKAKKGLLELADSGTLVLDEIGDMDPIIQSKLLPVLETRTIRRVGSTQWIPFDAMVIATTNRDLPQMMNDGIFRKDLYHRFSGCRLTVPALRERKEDIPLLSRYFIELYKKEYNRPSLQLSKEAIEVLKGYSWPGNVRELKGLLANIVHLEDTDLITPEHILPRLSVDGPANQHSSVFDMSLPLEDVERKMLQHALHKSNGNMAKAARILNISYEKIRYKKRKFGIK
jgi:DNA-binding NtrC family response regulator